MSTLSHTLLPLAVICNNPVSTSLLLHQPFSIMTPLDRLVHEFHLSCTEVLHITTTHIDSNYNGIMKYNALLVTQAQLLADMQLIEKLLSKPFWKFWIFKKLRNQPTTRTLPQIQVTNNDNYDIELKYTQSNFILTYTKQKEKIMCLLMSKQFSNLKLYGINHTQYGLISIKNLIKTFISFNYAYIQYSNELKPKTFDIAM